MTLTWTKQPVKDGLAQDLRRGIRRYRREKGKGNHRFRYDDLRILWSAGKNQECAVLTHQEDRIWQFWYRHEDGWKLESWHKLLRDAQSEAEKPRKKPQPAPVQQPDPGLYIHARWQAPHRGEKPMVVRCHTDYTVSVISDLFTRLGCSIEVKEVA